MLDNPSERKNSKLPHNQKHILHPGPNSWDELDYRGGESAIIAISVAPGFKNKSRYTPYVSLGSQISHVATNKGNINRQ